MKGAGRLRHKRISVLIPTWNRASELSSAITSVLAQSVAPLEVLVCDDGSDDGSEAVVRSFNDPRLKWLPGPHAGRPAVPRNRGLAVSEGEWIAFLDSDDRWIPEKLERQFLYAERLQCKAVCSNAYHFQPTGNLADCLLTWSKPKVTFDDLLYANYVVCSSAMIHCSLLEQVIGFPEDPNLTGFEDYALWLRVATRTDFAYLPEPLVIYNDDPKHSVRHDGPDSSTQKGRVIQDFLGWVAKTVISPTFRTKAEEMQSPLSVRVKARRLKHFLLRMRARVA